MPCLTEDKIWVVSQSAIANSPESCSPCVEGSTYVPSAAAIARYNGCFTLVSGVGKARDKIIMPSSPAGVLWLESDRVHSGRLRKVRQMMSGTVFEVDPMALPFDPSVGKKSQLKETTARASSQEKARTPTPTRTSSRYFPR